MAQVTNTDAGRKRVRLGENRYGWVDTEIDEWIPARVVERDGAEAA